MITIKEIAEMANVSPTTVSNVIHGRNNKVSQKNLEKVQLLLEKYNYVPRLDLDSLTKGKTKLIVVVIQCIRKYDTSILSDPFYGTLVGMLEKYIKEMGYFMMLSAEDSLNSIFKHALSWNVSGMICVSISHRDYMKLSSLLDCPLVGIDICDPQLKRLPDDGYYISLDDYDAGYQMGKYLISHGFRNIICVSDTPYGPSKLRQMGIKKAIDEFRLPIYKHSFPDFSPEFDKSSQDFHSLLPFIKKDYVIVCPSDQFAFRLINFLYQHNVKIPEDISVTGFDDNLYATAGIVKLTTVSQDIPERARQAVKLLENLIRTPDLPKQNHFLPVHIVPRNSVKL